MPTVLPMTRAEAYLAYKAGVIAESDLKPSLKTNFYSGLEHWLAYWCNLTADYPKDENNDPKWYTEEEYYVAYLCGIAQDYPVNCYRRVGAYLRYIISARWDKPEKPLTREEYYLSLMSTTYLPPNSPASIISIDDTAEAPFGDLKIYGDTFQQTYTGKNLFNKDSYEVMSGYFGSGDSVVGTPGYTRNRIIYIPCEPNTVYSITFPADSEVELTTRAVACSDSIPNSGVALSNAYRGVIAQGYTTTSTAQYICLYLQAPNGVDISSILPDIVKYIQIEKNATATSYEPYVGGIPAPNPDYPQDIQVVTGEQTVQVTGKNMLDETTMEQGGFNFRTGANYSNNNQIRSKPIKCLPSTTYVISGNEPLGEAAVVYGTQTGAVIEGSHEVTTAKFWSFTTPANAYSVRIRIGSSSYPKNTSGSYNIQLELGSTASDYMPYQGQTYPISLGTLELCKIGDYQDYIWTDGEKWYKREYVGRYIISDISLFSWSSDRNRLYISAANLASLGVNLVPPANNSTPLLAYSDRFSAYGFTAGYAAEATTINAVFMSGSGTLSFRSPAWGNNGTTARELLTGTTFYYALASPTDEEITDATLISQLNALLEGGSYNYQTNIVVSAADPNLPGLLQVTAAKWQ